MVDLKPANSSSSTYSTRETYKMARFSENLALFLALVGASVSAEMADPATVQLGDEICFEGFVMDNFCIERETLLDVCP